MSVMGHKLSISSMSTRFFRGRGSKKTGWKPSSVSCSPVELDSIESSSPMPCQPHSRISVPAIRHRGLCSAPSHGSLGIHPSMTCQGSCQPCQVQKKHNDKMLEPTSQGKAAPYSKAG